MTKTFLVILFIVSKALICEGQTGFERYKVASASINKLHPINYKSNITARQFRTRLTTDYNKNGINFAGHYSFVEWGCGSPCQSSAIIDGSTGKVYEGPTSALGYDLRKDSRLLIVNPKDTAGFLIDCPYCDEEHWLWDEQRKRFRKIDRE